jgi:hypothetical protein
MAQLLCPDGSTKTINGPLTLENMQLLVGGYVEFVRISTGELLVIDEEGLLKEKPLNEQATALYRGTPPRHMGVIVGDAIRCVCTGMGTSQERYS